MPKCIIISGVRVCSGTTLYQVNSGKGRKVRKGGAGDAGDRMAQRHLRLFPSALPILPPLLVLPVLPALPALPVLPCLPIGYNAQLPRATGGKPRGRQIPFLLRVDPTACARAGLCQRADAEERAG